MEGLHSSLVLGTMPGLSVEVLRQPHQRTPESMPIQTVASSECRIVNRRQLLKSCGACRRFERDRTSWHARLQTGKAADNLQSHLRPLHPAPIRLDGQEWWNLEVSRLLHEYEAHDVPHRAITGRDNYLMSISEISRFTNPQFTKHIKAIVKGRARHRCECCGRSWTEVTHPDEETVYFKTLENLWNGSLFADTFRLSELGRTTYAEYAIGVGLDRCSNCAAALQIATRWWTGEPNRIRPSRWFQVHHKNFQHFDNRLDNLEYLCGNCHGQKGRMAGKKRKDKRVGHGEQYVHGLINFLRSQGITLSYIFLSERGIFSWAVVGPISG